MTTDSSSADPARTIALLWGTQRLPQRGPRHALTSAQIVAAAIGIADAEKDLSSLSMRRVAESLGVGTMSLYTYVASRAELVEAMLDSVYGEAVTQLEKISPSDWRNGLRHVAAANWEMYLQHPWTLQVFTGRPPLGPNAIAKYDLELRVVDGIGLTDIEMDAAITLVHTHVEGLARRKLEAERARQHSGIADIQWWQVAGPALAKVLDPSRFPIAGRVGTAAGQVHQAAYNLEHEYVFGLDRLIEGIAALIHRPDAR
ncbi:TetR/AcrR family transcriptional regulator C-terminal domain-containing protein [Mangrovihabitans endophyticus]|uniref:TetR family transcriptional regulator n=1 Tax=Mangrovihabitans endophyticus TaxID=1751298 RepID=A0A8J3BYM4_9ACTN|nr:TetR/AcrR family transcriptional regulator C-terminal domain-containing protein [Mangrovihabitans endophyticus]GGK94255.1 TetR family transcriptional regulator [Mangrovihabitans endophyticus]